MSLPVSGKLRDEHVDNKQILNDYLYYRCKIMYVFLETQLKCFHIVCVINCQIGMVYIVCCSPRAMSSCIMGCPTSIKIIDVMSNQEMTGS